MKKIISLAVLVTMVAGCNMNTGPSTTDYDGFSEEPLIAESTGASLNDAYLLAAAPMYYVGDAYKVDDVQYIPVEDMTYNQTGIAGVIPAGLNGTKTKNGELFDSNQMLATSKTLPLPTIARVTNLDNGQSVVVRVNNRGPYVNTRIMDLSSAAARKIGMTGQTKVQIQVLPEQSAIVKNATLGTTATQSVVIPEPVVETAVQVSAPTPGVVTPAGDYSVQIAALYSEDNANSLVAKMRTYGNAVVVHEGGLYKVRIIDLSAQQARGVIDALRSNEGMVPGLLKAGRWVNPDSI